MKCLNCGEVKPCQKALADLDQWYAVDLVKGLRPVSKDQKGQVALMVDIEPAIVCPSCFHKLGLDSVLVMPPLPDDIVTKKDLNT